MRKGIILAFMILSSVLLQANEYRTVIYQAYLGSRMDVWKAGMEQMEADFSKQGDFALLYDLAEARYGYIAFCISSGKQKEARSEMKKARSNIQTLMNKTPLDPKVYSLMGAIHGFMVILEPLKAPVYGRRSAEANRMAIEMDPGEPRAWMEKANMEFYKPRILGGSVQGAVPLYEKAVRLFESNPESTLYNWVYLNCLTGLGMAYEKNGQILEAGRIYARLLELEPSFSWVRDDLYPGYLEKHSQDSSP